MPDLMRVRYSQVLSWALAFAIVVTGIGWWLVDPANLPVRRVQLQGTFEQLAPQVLEQEVAAALRGNFLTQDLTELEQHLLQHPWVEEVRVRRIWPHTLRIDITEQVAAARWMDGRLLNAKGVHFSPPQDMERGLVHLSGIPGREPQLIEVLHQARAMLAPHDLQITHIHERRDRSLTLTLEPPMQLVLGNTQPLERLHRWLRYREAYLPTAPRSATVVDLRYPNGFAVRPVTSLTSS